MCGPFRGDDLEPPSPQTDAFLINAAPELSYAPSNGLRGLNPLWLHRTFLGTTGIAVAQALIILENVGSYLTFVAFRTHNLEFEPLFHWMGRLYDVSFAIQWFSALYLLASPRAAADERDSFSLHRRALLYAGCAWVFMRSVPGAMFSGELARLMGNIALMVGIGASVTLFLYLMKIAEQSGDAFLKRNLPLALTLTILSESFYVIVRIRLQFRQAEDVRQMMSIAAAVYFLSLLWRLRKLVGEAIPTAEELAAAAALNSPQQS